MFRAAGFEDLSRLRDPVVITAPQIFMHKNRQQPLGSGLPVDFLTLNANGFTHCKLSTTCRVLELTVGIHAPGLYTTTNDCQQVNNYKHILLKFPRLHAEAQERASSLEDYNLWLQLDKNRGECDQLALVFCWPSA